jgi:uncharacterized OB-fold protein
MRSREGVENMEAPAVNGVEVTRDDRSAPFFDAAADGRLLLLRCPACAAWSAPYVFWRDAVVVCPACHSDGLEWAESPGNGVIVSWTVIHERAGTNDATTTRTVAIVELDEGPWMTLAFQGDPHHLQVGLSVVVDFDQAGSGEALPVVRIVDRDSTAPPDHHGSPARPR